MARIPNIHNLFKMHCSFQQGRGQSIAFLEMMREMEYNIFNDTAILHFGEENMGKEAKTNAMRILENNGIPYKSLTYPCEDFIDGITIADMLGQERRRTFKTLVCRAKSTALYVFVIPVDTELDMKKAAKACGERWVELLPLKDVTSATGYVRGGCSPLGMKKNYPTFFDSSALDFDTIFFSAGRRGCQIETAPADVCRVSGGSFADISRLEEPQADE